MLRTIPRGFCERKMQNGSCDGHCNGHCNGQCIGQYMLDDPEWNERLQCFINKKGERIIYTGLVIYYYLFIYVLFIY